MYICQFCNYQSHGLIPYLAHRQLHFNITQNFHCGFNGCKKMFRLEGSLRAHLWRVHSVRLKKRTINALDTTYTEHTNYVCTIPLCQKEFDSRQKIIKHVNYHIRRKERVKCPFANCVKEYDVLHSFSGHVSKKHPPSTRNLAVDMPALDCAVVAVDENQLVQEIGELSILPDFDNDVVDDTRNEYSKDLFNLNVAQLFLKLESSLLVPVSTLQTAILGISNAHEQSNAIMKSNLRKLLESENVASDRVNSEIDKICEENPFSEAVKLLNTAYKRKQFYISSCAFVEPVEVLLSEDHNDKTFFHYVPIHETAKQLFTDKSLSDQLRRNFENCEKDVLEDFTDGSLYKESVFFKKNPNALKIILYQDAFEVVNPIGSAIHKHKLIGIYFSVGNFPEYIRSHVNSIKLVALCKEKEFDHEKVYGKIVQDLKELEITGVHLPSGENVKGSLVFIVGDNLGSHELGGFVTNFSTSKHFCRYCLFTRDELNDDVQCLTAEARTIENYNYALGEKNKADHYQGIKFNSKFNELSHFHVCAPGLPPCLGHDLLEGVVAYDLKIFIDYFIQAEWFSISFLNRRIDSFNYSKEDSRDKPCPVSIKKKRIVGGAWQICIFLKLFPLFIVDKIENHMDDMWQAVLLLEEIVEIVCAPKINKHSLPYLDRIISEYMVLRKTLAQNVRPKHHYLRHYPELILKFGPLMKVWSMRFESKHTYFKRVLRYSRNYINVTKSLCEKHELMQSFIRSGADIRPVIELKGNSHFEKCLYPEKIQQAVESIRLPQQCNQAMVKGITYKVGDCLIIGQRGYQYGIEVGKIVLILSDEEVVFMVFEVLKTRFVPYLRVYEIGQVVKHVCLPLHELPSTEKLTVYHAGSLICVKPNYALVARSL